MQKRIEPMPFIHAWRFVMIAILIHLWFISGASTHVFVLILLLLIFSCLRWRFSLPLSFVLVDILICFLYFPMTHISYYGLALPIFELALKGKWLISLLVYISLFAAPQFASSLFWFYTQASFFGAFSYFALQNQQTYKREVDDERKMRYELERIKLELLDANFSTAQYAELMERYRISRELHDHLGHDLTGASLALQAYEHVQDPKEAKKWLEEVKNRIVRSTKILRETVHNMSPTTLIGVERLEYIVNHFHQVDVHWNRSGNMLKVPAHTWSLLEACLKEALTNVARHSNAEKIEVDLHVTDALVRLSIQDDGPPLTKRSETSQSGSGIRSLQMRSRALGGSLSIKSDDGFLLVCVIPIEKERTDE